MDIDDIAAEARAGRRIAPTTVLLDSNTAVQFCAMRADPRRFTPAIFDGDWADPSKTATAGEMLIVAAVACADDVIRVLGRQNKRLYALTRTTRSAKAKQGRRKAKR